MSENCLSKNPLLRDGTSQQQRLLKALLPSFVAVDERSLKDLVLFVNKLASEINYHEYNAGTDHIDTSNWEDFFHITDQDWNDFSFEDYFSNFPFKFFPKTFNEETGQREGGYNPDNETYQTDKEGRLIYNENGQPLKERRVQQMPNH